MLHFEPEDRIRSRDQVDTGGHHGGCVDERGDRCRSFHRVRQPCHQRELGALSEGSDHQEPGDQVGRPSKWGITHLGGGQRAIFRHGQIEVERLKEAVVFKCSEVEPDQPDRDGESEVADPVHDERLLGGIDGGGLLVVVADEQVTGEADTFPAKVEHDEVVAEHQCGHGEEEDAHRTEESRVSLAPILIHVFGGVERDAGSQPRHEQHPEQGEIVDVKCEIRGDVFKRTLRAPRKIDPVEEMDHDGLAGFVPCVEHAHHDE